MRSTLGILILAAKRSVHNVRMLLATFLGLVIAVSLVSAVPMYSDGVLSRLLTVRLTAASAEVGRPPASVWLRTLIDDPADNTVARYWQLDDYVQTNIEGLVGLPIKRSIRYVSSTNYVLWPSDERGNVPQNERRYAALSFLQGIQDHIRIIDGTGLDPSRTKEGDIRAIVSVAAAELLHVRVGERYLYTDVEKYNPQGVPIQIVGIWEPTDTSGDFWLYDPAVMDKELFLTEANMFNDVLNKMPKTAHEFAWYSVFDETQLHATNAGRVLGGLDFLETHAGNILPGTRIVPPIRTTLEEFATRSYLLNILLFALSLPMLAVVLYFIASSIGMVIERQRGEIALLKSRGASTFQVIGVYLCESVLMGAIALAIGPFIGTLVAQLVGHAYGFLLFANRPPLELRMGQETVQYSTIAVGLAVLATLFPAIGAARHSIISYKQDVARSSRLPVWQRFFVDVLLLAVAGYGYYTLRGRQSIVTTDVNQQFVIEPLLLIVPAFFIFAVGLMFLRVFPLVTAGLGKIASLVGGPSVLLALRQIARTPVQYMTLVLLLIVTLALGAYSASAAHTIDRNLAERTYYDIPADLEITELWQKNTIPGSVAPINNGAGAPDSPEGYYTEPPFEDHFVGGVVDASPFKTFKVTPDLRGAKDGQLLAIDRLSFPRTDWWRIDFADKSLGALMNALGAGDAAAIVDRGFLQDYQLRVGDSFTLEVDKTSIDFYVAEAVDYFPTLYPEDGHFFVANLDYLYDQIGIQPYQVWLKLLPGTHASAVVDSIRGRNILVANIRDSRVEVNQGRTDPQRTGLFGILTVGFAVAALLTVLGFFLYSFLSFEKRLLQMGILRAMGLSIRQLFGLLIFEQVYLIALGLVFGTGLGIAAGNLFIPFLQVSSDAKGRTPPFVIETAWTDIGRIYVVLGLMLVVGLVSTIWLISRMKLYQTVKLGEEQ